MEGNVHHMEADWMQSPSQEVVQPGTMVQGCQCTYLAGITTGDLIKSLWAVIKHGVKTGLEKEKLAYRTKIDM